MIAILSDFGNSEYLGVMKGVIYSINSNAKVVDLNNNINQYIIKEGAWVLLSSFSYFPRKTVFLCVVDPGVGGKRKGIAIKTKNYFFVGPDNGIMYPAAKKDGILEVIKIKEAKNKNMAKTFHGRDLFAKIAASVDSKQKIENIGNITKVESKLNFYLNGSQGEVVRIDNFGNIVTNIRHFGKDSYFVKYSNKSLRLDFCETYELAPQNTLFLIEGSSNTLEISIKQNSAQNKLKAIVGEKITIK